MDPGKREQHWILQSELQPRELGRTPDAAANKPKCEYRASRVKENQSLSQYCPFYKVPFYKEVKLHQDALKFSETGGRNETLTH